MRPGLPEEDVSQDHDALQGHDQENHENSPKKPKARPGWSCAVNSDDMAKVVEGGSIRMFKKLEYLTVA